MNWQYRSILFEFQKDGLLGDRYIDDDEMEKVLNDQGRKGWELVNVTPVQEGLLAFFKRVLQQPRKHVAVQTSGNARSSNKAMSGTFKPVSKKTVPDTKTSIVPAEPQAEKPKPQSDGIGDIKIRS